MFIDNKYTRWYYSIINNALSRNYLYDYKEKHHIIPKSLGGNDSDENLVNLTAREHFIVHWLLTKMTKNKNKTKMLWAFWRMCNVGENSKRYVNSYGYEIAKREFINEASKPKTQKHKENIRKSWTPERKKKYSEIFTGDRNPNYGNVYTKESRDKISKSLKGKMSGEKHHFYGKKRSEEDKNKISIKTKENMNNPETKRIMSEKAKKSGHQHKNAKKTQVRVSCIYCKKEIVGLGNLSRWHGDNCKYY